jgi:WASH complex subunit 7
LDGVINNLYHNFSEGADYFKMLVNVFASEYRSPENVHLKNFYLIIPALTLSFVETIGGDKDRFVTKGKKRLTKIGMLRRTTRKEFGRMTVSPSE